MVEGVPITIPIQSPSSVTSYTFSDIQEGTGIVKYYGASNYSNGSRSYILTTNTMYSYDIVISGAQVTTDGTQLRIAQQNYDVTFNRPQNLSGLAYLNISIGGTSISSFSGNKIWISGAQLQNSTTSTNITALISGAVHNWSAAAIESERQLIPLNITPIAHFKKGDTLRLSLDLWGYNAVGDLSHGGWGSDPQARADPTLKTITTTDTTKMELYVPFVLQV